MKDIIPSLNIDITTIDFDQFITKDNSECYFCDYRKASLNTYINKKIVKTCVLCNIISNFKTSFTESCLIYKSDIDQINIIKKTIKHIEKYKEIPDPRDIDNDIVKVNISVFQYINYLIANPDDSKNEKYKIFFSDSKPIYNYFGLDNYDPLLYVNDDNDKNIEFHTKKYLKQDIILNKIKNDYHL